MSTEGAGIKRSEKGTSVFDRMISALMSEQGEYGYLDDCMSWEIEAVNKVPLRYRIIALGFAKHLSLDELNEKLKSQGCAGLYSRSLWEASLIYAFKNGLSYEDWKELQEICFEVRNEKVLADRYFQESRITLRDLKKYIDDNSELSNQVASTQHLTKVMDQKLSRLALGKSDFQDFLLFNIESLTPVREKTRYYFCKYLYYYLQSCMDRYLNGSQNAGVTESEIDDLAVFKGITALKRKKLSEEETRELLNNSGLSFGAVFDAFNYYFFDYVSLDWMEVLLDYYGSIHAIPNSDQSRLAQSLRNYEPEKYAAMTDGEVLASKQKELEKREEDLDAIYSLDGTNKGYQRNRAGENTIRKYVKGGLDIDRVTLVCFLIFFGSKSDLPDEYVIEKSRLNMILNECGFAGLREDDAFDDFVIRYLESSDPTDLLMNEVTDYAFDEENFFLYKTYLSSRSAQQDIDRLL